MKLLVKKLYEDENIVIPKYATKGSVAFDICSIEDHWLFGQTGFVTFVKTGLAFAIPEGYEMNVRARSGLSIKYPNYIAIAGGGTIDSDYRGEIMVPVVNNSTEVWEIKKGDRIAQCIVAPVKICELELTETLPETKRGTGGFGHTGIK